jgi:UDP-N-acetyl-D-mannosaminuronic acid dehydrogenase
MENQLPRRLCILGLGYIGLPSASMFATRGFDVLGVDVHQHVIDTLNRGEIHIAEPGLATMVAAAVNSGNLKASLEPRPSDVFFIAVPTPVRPDRSADLSYVEQASESIVPHLRKGNLVILESTSPPGTTANVVAPILEKSGLKAGADFHLAHTPERVLPGQIMKELIDNDRIIGGIDQASAEAAMRLYRVFVEGEIFLTDATTAEMAKLIENTYRDVNIAFSNEIARICEKLGVSVWDVIRLANRHPRVNVLNPGPGVGGHCIAVDPWFIVQAAPEEAKAIRLAREINDEQPLYVARCIERLIAGQDNPKITFLGVTYKANVDDTREAPAEKIIEYFEEKNIPFSIHDPFVKKYKHPLSNLDDALAQSTCVALLVGHSPLTQIDPGKAAGLMKQRVLVDTANLLDHARWRKAGFETYLLGANLQSGS